ncbi:prepilin peptidase [Listeria fleischmannii]
MLFTCVCTKFPTTKPFLFRRSHCDYCEKSLSYHQMIPIFSFFIQKGRTKCCKKKLSPLYIIQEISLPFLILLFYGLFKFEFMTSIHFIIFLFLYFFLLTDLYFLHVPNLMILLFLIIVCFYRFLYYSMILIIIQFIASLFVYSLFYFFVRKGFGLGDIKILIILGTALGFVNSYKFSLFH